VEAAAQSSDPALKRAARRILSTESDGATEPKTGRILMLLTIEKVLLLKSVPLFSGLDGEELAAVADLALETFFQPGCVTPTWRLNKWAPSTPPGISCSGKW
jgi:hypothetical protein